MSLRGPFKKRSEYIISNAVLDSCAFILDFPCVLQSLLVEGVVNYLKSITVLQWFLEKCTFEVDLSRKEKNVWDDMDHLLHLDVPISKFN